MNEGENINEPQPWIDPALEARIVAAVAGETSAFEAAELERAVAENPELAIFKRRIEAVHALVGEAVRPQQPGLQLSPERRRKLLETIGAGVDVPVEKVRVMMPVRGNHWLQPLLAAAACLAVVGILATLSVPAVNSSLVAAKRSASAGKLKSEGEKSPITATLASRSEVDEFADEEPLRTDASAALPAAPAAAKPMELASNNTSSRTDVEKMEQDGSRLETARALVSRHGPSRTAIVADDTARSASVDAVTEDPGQKELEDSMAMRKVSPAASNGSADGLTSDEAVGTGGMKKSKVADDEPLARPEPGSGVAAASAPAGPTPTAFYEVVEDPRVPISDVRLPDEEAPTGGVAGKAGSAEPGLRPRRLTGGTAITAGELKVNGQSRDTVAEATEVGASAGFGSAMGSAAVEEGAPADGGGTVFSGGFSPSGSKSGTVTSGGGRVKVAEPEKESAASPSAAPEEKPELAKQLLREAEGFSETGRYDLALKRYSQVLQADKSNVAARRGMEEVNESRQKYLEGAYNKTRSMPIEKVDAMWELPVEESDKDQSGSFEAPAAASPKFWNEHLSTGSDRLASDRAAEQDAPANQRESREAKAELTKRLLDEAQGYFSRGSYDLAAKRYEQVLNADRSSLEARKGIENVIIARQKYDRETNNATRSRMLWQVTKGWELPVHRLTGGRSTPTLPADASAKSVIARKLIEIILPSINFREATVQEALAYLHQRAQALDSAETDPARKGIGGMVLALPPGAPEANNRITLALENVPLGEALRYVATAASLKMKVEPYGVTLVPLNDSAEAKPQPRPSLTPSSAYHDEVATEKQPFSTFSLHVSDVSFQLAKDALAKGSMPDADKIRTEEFYNAFDYGDPAPAAGQEVACRIEQAAHPLLQQRDLVRIALKVAAAGRDAAQPLRLTILLDTSGSMEREDRAVSVRRALQALATLLGPNDRVTLIGFARTPRLLAEQVPGNEAGKLVEIAEHTPSEGGTNLELALKLASELALKQKLPAAQNRIVLLTDGAANLGNANPAELSREIEKTRQQGISFDACGVGAKGLNDEVLEALTRQGDGRYYFLNKPEDADAGFARQLAGAFRPAAENVKVQVVFNPTRVSQYRLLGFEKHLLKKEDFRNDQVQAAELSAEEAGVALYQVETLPGGEGDLGQVFVRFRDPATGVIVERSWPIPYEAKAPSFEQASPSLQLAATAALLAERLRGDAQVDLNVLAPVAANLRSHYPHQVKVGELIQMLERVRQ